MAAEPAPNNAGEGSFSFPMAQDSVAEKVGAGAFNEDVWPEMKSFAAGPVRHGGSAARSGPYSSDALQADDKAALVMRVKALQRCNVEGRVRWSNFCEFSGTRKHDPNAHDEAFLRSFFEALEMGNIPLESPTASTTSVAASAAPPSAGKVSLVQLVKNIQRTDPEAKVRWVNFCESHGHRKHDPNAHDEAFLNTFFDALARGEIPLEPVQANATQPGVVQAGAMQPGMVQVGNNETASQPLSGPLALPNLDGGKDGLVQAVKNIQRGDPISKQRWVNYCEMNGHRKHDPNVHEEGFLVSFFQALRSGEIPTEAIVPATSSQERPCNAQDAIVGGKTTLVAFVKNLQRTDPSGKNRWIHFCESHGQKKHDPGIHDEAFLVRFVHALERGDIPDDPSGKIALVQKIKELQRKSARAKLNWTEYCDRAGYGKHDPNLYDVDFLTQFILSAESESVPSPPPQHMQQQQMQQMLLPHLQHLSEGVDPAWQVLGPLPPPPELPPILGLPPLLHSPHQLPQALSPVPQQPLGMVAPPAGVANGHAPGLADLSFMNQMSMASSLDMMGYYGMMTAAWSQPSVAPGAIGGAGTISGTDALAGVGALAGAGATAGSAAVAAGAAPAWIVPSA